MTARIPAGTPAPYVAQLRVYEPLAAFGVAEREHWQDYLARGAAPSREQGPALERAAGLVALLGLAPPCLPDLPEQAYVTEVDGVTLVSPWSTRLRSLAAVQEVRAGLPALLADTFIPRGVAEAAERELAAERRRHPDRRVHVLSSCWQVPARWFVLVEAQERVARRGEPGGAGVGAPARTGRSLVYRTAMSRARRRVARALAVLRRSLDDEVAVAGLEQLGRWLEEFHPRSLVELDYGALVHLLDDDALEEDESAGDVAAAIAALAQGEHGEASAAYARVTARRAVLQSVETAG